MKPVLSQLKSKKKKARQENNRHISHEEKY